MQFTSDHVFDHPSHVAHFAVMLLIVLAAGCSASDSDPELRLSSTDSEGDDVDAVMLVSNSGEHVPPYTGPFAEEQQATYPIVTAPWVQQAKLLPADGAAEDRFGWSMAVSGDTIVVGTPRDDSQTGSAYVFEDDGAGFVQTTRLTRSDGAAGDRFGWSVAVSGDTIVVGGYPNDRDPASGSVSVFEDDGDGFVETTRLVANDAASGDGEAIDGFGFSVAMSGDTIVVGAPGSDGNEPNSGSAYVFEHSGDGFVETTKLVASDGEEGDEFALSVAVSSDTIVVGAPFDDENGSTVGSAYVFEDTGSGLVETTRLAASDGEHEDLFGRSVAVSGDTIVVGALLDNNNNGTNSGSAFVFEDTGSGFVHATTLEASDGSRGDVFGYPVAISGDTIVVGARRDDDNGTDSGSAYVFKNRGSGFVEATKLVASDGAADDWFGFSVAVSGDTIVAGARRDDDNGTDSGSAYVFTPGPNASPVALAYRRVDTIEDVARPITLWGTDSDGDLLTFEIVGDPPNGTLSITTADGPQTGTVQGFDTTTLDVTYTATSETATTDTFIYRVDDGNGGSDEGMVRTYINHVNDQPIITSTAPTMATENLLYTYNATATDPDAEVLSWTTFARDTCRGTFSGSTYTFTPAGPSPADCVVGIRVCDDGTPRECDIQTTTVTITPNDDTGDPDDTDPDEMPDDTDPVEMPDDTDPGQLSGGTDKAGGCASASAPSNGLWALVVLALLRLRRRKNRAAG